MNRKVETIRMFDEAIADLESTSTHEGLIDHQRLVLAMNEAVSLNASVAPITAKIVNLGEKTFRNEWQRFEMIFFQSWNIEARDQMKSLLKEVRNQLS